DIVPRRQQGGPRRKFTQFAHGCLQNSRRAPRNAVEDGIDMRTAADEVVTAIERRADRDVVVRQQLKGSLDMLDRQRGAIRAYHHNSLPPLMAVGVKECLQPITEIAVPLWKQRVSLAGQCAKVTFRGCWSVRDHPVSVDAAESIKRILQEGLAHPLG